jgi:CRP-like cAMP-binding protein
MRISGVDQLRRQDEGNVNGSSEGGLPSNMLLARLPAADFARIRPHLSTVQMPLRSSYQEVNDRLPAVYFPNTGVASIVSGMSDGTVVETTTVGREGMIGIEASFGDDPLSICKCVQQVGDATAERMLVAAFREELARRGALHEIVGRYARVLLATALQAAACNALHDLPARCARWLLMTHDRIGDPQFGLSHEYLAMMLGVHRPTVSVAAGALQRDGIIKYRHGTVTVLDRAGLEASACECYAITRQQFENAGLLYPS